MRKGKVMTKTKEKTYDEKNETSEIDPAHEDKLKDPKKEWDMVDEEGDESFPASDPPANY
ncbi:MAG: hypothetical protein CBB65_13555 [Hyphomonadaceae bacterium TMED5]|nr:hypothetical protein [Ponticaulis sp.]OUX97817.1 MAG: hypothetical protein CBB65_13555 [Hyphomonadaceae bacterium TMED5]|tara:strand:- start:28122 stop:28301 length:180 start_codon:yes stop_codon:yes gene_type:complete